MTAGEDDGSESSAPTDRWGDDLDLPERVIVVPAPVAGAVAPPEGDAGETSPDAAVAPIAASPVGSAGRVVLDEGADSAAGAAPERVQASEPAAPDADKGSPPEADAPDAGAIAGGTFALDARAPGPAVGVDSRAAGPDAAAAADRHASVFEPTSEGPPTEAVDMITELQAEDDGHVLAVEPTSEGPPTAAVDITAVLQAEDDEGPDEAAPARTATARPERDETGPGALRPSAPEPVSIHRGPSRSRQVVSRLRAFVGLLLVVALSGVGVAAAIGAAVLVVAFVVKRAFGS
jgi:hypothetical protein